MLVTCLHISFTSDIHNLKESVREALEYLKQKIPYLTKDDLSDMRFIYSELISNAIIHGNKNDYTKKIDLYIEVDSCIIISVVKDEGLGFDYSNLLNSNQLENNFFDECGRGLKLVISLSDLVEWNDTGNEVMFCKKI